MEFLLGAGYRAHFSQRAAQRGTLIRYGKSLLRTSSTQAPAFLTMGVIALAARGAGIACLRRTNRPLARIGRAGSRAVALPPIAPRANEDPLTTGHAVVLTQALDRFSCAGCLR